MLGIVLAVAQPGNLGDNDETAASTSTSSSSSSSTTAADGTTTTAGEESTTTTAVESTTTTNPNGSGLESDGSGSVDDGDLSSTGGPEWLLPVGAVLLAVGVSARRLSRA